MIHVLEIFFVGIPIICVLKILTKLCAQVSLEVEVILAIILIYNGHCNGVIILIDICHHHTESVCPGSVFIIIEFLSVRPHTKITTSRTSHRSTLTKIKL